MTVRFLMNVGGAINAKKGNIRNLSEQEARQFIHLMICEEWFQPPPKHKHKPIIVHTRCIPQSR